MLTRALVCPTLVGRDNELQQLVERRLASARAHGALMLISGDAGIGKSRLLVSFRKTLRGGRASLGVGLCREYGNSPYGPLIEALRGAGVSGPFSTAATRPEQLAEFAEQTAAVCRRRCVVLLIEDLQWADDGTLHFLQHILSSITSLRLLIVATYRADEACRLQQLEPHLARLVRDRATHRILLGPLSPSELRRLVKLAAGQSRRLAQAQLEEIVERSDGNPFFAEELLKNALEGARQLPLTVRGALLERVRGMDDRAREVLTHASVVGRRFTAEFIAEICGMETPEVLAHLGELRRLQLVDEIAGETSGYTFRHALTREAVYEQLLAAQARPLHAQILRALEQHPGSNAEDMGYHAWASHDAGKCLRYNEQAADESDKMHAYAEAIRCYMRALEGATQAAERGRLLAKAAACCGKDGRAAQAVEIFADAAAAYESAGCSAELAGIYQAMSAQARIAGDNERGMRILEQALEVVPDSQTADRAALLLNLAYMRLDRCEVEEAGDLIAQARGADTYSYHNVLQYSALVRGDVRAFRSQLDGGKELSAQLGEYAMQRAKFNEFFGLTILGFDREALARFGEMLPKLQELRLASLEVLAYANAALICARNGQSLHARELVERAASAPESTTTGPIALAAAALTVGFDLWDEELIARLCSDAIVEAAFSSRINSTLGRLAGPYARWLHANGDTSGAQAILERAMKQLAAPFGATETILTAAELGGPAASRAAFGFIDRLEATPQVQLYAATAHHLRALRAKNENERNAAAQHAREAVALYLDMGWVTHEAKCLELSGDSRRAAAEFRRLRAGGTVRSSAAPVLSQREREIASLVATGAANRKIAESLAVNQRTVEKHLTSIFGKLGVRNRSELAAFIARERPSVGK